jgi:D-sedoheptulose 7-phosphate isomerase
MNHVEDLVRLYLDEKVRIAGEFPVADTARLIEAVWSAYLHDGTVFIFANGGPAGAAEGFATDLKTHPFTSESKHETTEIRRLRVVCLNESCGVITGIANDLGYDHIFREQLKNYLRGPEQNRFDLVIGFSGSGNSGNVLNAFSYAKQFGATTACLTGRGGGKAREAADICVVIPGSSSFPGQTGANDNNFHIEDFQTSITHMVTGVLKERVMKLHEEKDCLP